jgi:cell shape-determining protein MreC
MIDITIPENVKKVVLMVAVIMAAIGFAGIAGLLQGFEEDFAVLLAAVNSAIATFTAYFTKVKDTIKNPKGE